MNLTMSNNDQWYYENFIRKGDLVVIKYKASVDATWIALAFATSKNELFNRYQTTAEPWVLYCNGSLPYDEIVQRMEQVIGLDENQGQIPLIASFENIFDAKDEYASYPTFRDRELWDQLLQTIKDNNFGCIIYDNASSLFQDQGDDDSKWLISEILALRKKKITQIFFVPDIKGTFTIPEAFIDLKLQVTGRKDNGHLMYFVEILKSLYLSLQHQEPFLLELNKDENGNLALVDKKSEENHKIKALMMSLYGQQSQSEIGPKVGRNQTTVSRWFAKFEKDGLVEQKNGRVTKVTDAGRAWLKGNGMNPEILM